MNKEAIDLSVTLGKIRLENPVMPASGTFGYGEEFANFLNLKDLGAIVVKGTTLKPRLGNFQYRFTEAAGCASNFTIGLQNVGIEKFIKEKLPYLRQVGSPVIVNIAGDRIEEYVRLTEILNSSEGVKGIEINMACPNVEKGGRQFSADTDMTFKLVSSVRKATDLTIIPKLMLGRGDGAVLAKACEEAGADAICPNYSVVGMSIDINSRKPKLGKNLMGAVGGPWRKPIAIRMAFEAARAVDIPVVGCGGITEAEDAIEFFIAGATAVQIGTFNLINPSVTVETIEGIRNYLLNKGCKSLSEIIGSIKLD